MCDGTKETPFRLIYVDVFVRSGRYESPDAEAPQSDGGSTSPRLFKIEYAEMAELHRGSAALALEIENKAFDQFRFIDKDPECVKLLKEKLVQKHSSRDFEVKCEDATTYVPRFCGKMARSERALVLLDPFATEVSWTTVKAIAQT